ncbi:MAG: Rrf2 family transcriptional regulator, partial [Armatimonadota bacterium]
MNFTAREDYGLRAALDLALNVERGPVQSREIATRQGIPEQFLEQLLGALRRGGLVRSVRGA